MPGFPADIMFTYRSGKPSLGTAKEERERERNKEEHATNTSLSEKERSIQTNPKEKQVRRLCLSVNMENRRNVKSSVQNFLFWSQHSFNYMLVSGVVFVVSSTA